MRSLTSREPLGYDVLPVIPEGADPRVVLANNLHRWQVASWTHSAADAADDVLMAAGLLEAERRVFVSYRQRESAGIAEQLFEALGKLRFEVFVDRFCVPPGCDFQAYLTDELAHKAMMIVLESDGMDDSDYVAHELAYAATYDLGRVAVALPGGRAQSLVPDALRVRVSRADLIRVPSVPASGLVDRDDTLQPAKLREVIDLVNAEHRESLLRRRLALLDSLRGALYARGVTRQSVRPGGHLQVDVSTGHGASAQYVVWARPRPPLVREFRDGHRVSRGGPPPHGVIVTAALYRSSQRRAEAEWLAGVSDVRLADEGGIAALADRMSRGLDP